MKPLLLVCLIHLFSTTLLQAQFQSIVVHVSQIHPIEGELSVALYNKAADFPHHRKVYKAKTPKVNASTMSVRFDSLPQGTYAIAVYHDRNANKKLDKNMLGAPTEPYGFSNNARRLMSAPSFEESTIKLNGSTPYQTDITLK